MEALRIGVEARRRVGIDLAHVSRVTVVRSGARVVPDVGIRKLTAFEPAENLVGRLAEFDSQMIDEAQSARRIDPRKCRHFRIGRAALHQRTTGVVADPAEYRRADTARADHGMWLAAERFQHFLQLIERCPRKADDLLAVVDDIHLLHAGRADDHDVAIVVVAVRRRAAHEARIRSLRNDDHVCRDACLQHLPLFDDGAWAHHRQRLACAETKTRAVASGRAVIRQDVLLADDVAQIRNEALGRAGRQVC